MKTLVWFRRDLRLHDHAALAYATKNSEEVYAVFVFDRHILGKLTDKKDSRLQFIHDSLIEMEETLQKNGSSIKICDGIPEEEIPRYAKELKVSAVYTNRDYEPYAKARDHKVAQNLKELGIDFHTFKDSVIFEAKETLKDDGTPYRVFTPYMRKWMSCLHEQGDQVEDFQVNLKKMAHWNNSESISQIDWIKRLGFENTPPHFKAATQAALKRQKDFLQII